MILIGRAQLHIAAVILLLAAVNARAEYVATGPIQGSVCKGFIIESCKFHQLHAVKGDDGRLFTIRERYDSVSEHRSGRCWIRTKSKGAGLLSWGANAISQPEFYEKTSDGKYNKLDVEYLVFPCVERK